MQRRWNYLFVAFFATVFALSLHAIPDQTKRITRELEDAKIEKNIGDKVPLQLRFTDQDLNQVRLGKYFNQGKPVLITFNYANCPQLCGLQLSDLARAMREIDWKPHTDFEIITISVDPTQEPKRTKQFKNTFVAQAAVDGADAGWHFLTTDENADILAAAHACGYYYHLDPKSGEYLHKSALIIVTPDGRISNYIPNFGWDPQILQRGLESAKAGEVGADIGIDPNTSNFFLSCFQFDPNSAASIGLFIMRMCGIAIVLFLFGYMGFWWIRDLRRRRRAGSPNAA